LQEGVEDAFKCCNHDLLLEEEFWKEICDVRINYIDQLLILSNETNINHIAINLHHALMEYHSRISQHLFVDIFSQYFKQREKWRTILSSI
jgi:hypothetical protein